MGYPDANSFHGLRKQNVDRCEESYHKIADWSPSDWATAVTGELGEACNLIKKLRRLETEGLNAPANADTVSTACGFEEGDTRSDNLKLALTHKFLLEKIADELADTLIYIDLLCARLDINLGAAVISKFNRTSEKIGSNIKLPY